MRFARLVQAALLLAACTVVAQQPDDLLRQGFALHQQARFDEAIPYFERVLKSAPNDYFANLLLGIDQLRIGKPAESLPHLTLAARVNPAEELADGYLGEAEADLGHFAQAAAAYQEALKRARAKNQPEDALMEWAGFGLERFRALNEELRSTDAGSAAAKRLHEGGAQLQCAGSIALMERGLTLQRAQKSRVDAVYQLAVCYAVEAGKAADEFKGGAEDQAALHRLRGDVLLRLSEDPAGAVTEYKAALELRPGDPALLERLAEAEFSAGDELAAKADAEAALKIDPHRRGALRTLASLEMNSRDYESAVPTLRTLVQEEPGSVMLRVELAVALAQTGGQAEAVRLLAPALAAGYPDEKGALHAVLAHALRKLGRKAEAEQAEAAAKRLSDKFQSEGGHESQ